MSPKNKKRDNMDVLKTLEEVLNDYGTVMDDIRMDLAKQFVAKDKKFDYLGFLERSGYIGD